MRKDLISAIVSHQGSFGIDLSNRVVEQLADYYELIQKHSSLLHLVAPCSPEEFAVRHILESLTLLEFLPQNAKVADIGAGAGLPSIPCLMARKDLKVTLIETKEKKAKFLETAIDELKLSDRAAVVNRQFEETDPVNVRFITCRALDKFTEKLPRLIKWSKGRGLLFFGGPALGTEMRKYGLSIEQKLMPLSERRYLFISRV